MVNKKANKRKQIEVELDKKYLNKVKILNDGVYIKDYKGNNSHFYLITGYKINPKKLSKEEANILVNGLTSLVDKEGNIDTNKRRKIEYNLIIEIPKAMKNKKRRSGIKINVDNFHITKNRKLKVKDLKEPNTPYIIDDKFIKEFKDNIFDRNSTDRYRKRNVRISKNYKK